MDEKPASPKAWKQTIARELREYALNVVYLSLFFGMFYSYRRIILAQQNIVYANYGIAVIQAMVLGKLIMVGGLIQLGSGLEDKPLIYPTLFKSLVFTVWVGIFKVFEHAIIGMSHGRSLAEGYFGFLGLDGFEMLSGGLVVFVAFIPFFGVKELSRVLGKGKIQAIFFWKRTATEYSLSREIPGPSPPRHLGAKTGARR